MLQNQQLPFKNILYVIFWLLSTCSIINAYYMPNVGPWSGMRIDFFEEGPFNRLVFAFPYRFHGILKQSDNIYGWEIPSIWGKKSMQMNSLLKKKNGSNQCNMIVYKRFPMHNYFYSGLKVIFQ